MKTKQIIAFTVAYVIAVIFLIVFICVHNREAALITLLVLAIIATLNSYTYKKRF